MLSFYIKAYRQQKFEWCHNSLTICIYIDIFLKSSCKTLEINTQCPSVYVTNTHNHNFNILNPDLKKNLSINLNLHVGMLFSSLTISPNTLYSQSNLNSNWSVLHYWILPNLTKITPQTISRCASQLINLELLIYWSYFIENIIVKLLVLYPVCEGNV